LYEGARAPWGAPSGVTFIRCFKRHCYVAANKPCVRFLKVHFFLFFSLDQWEKKGKNALSKMAVVADRVLQSFEPTDS